MAARKHAILSASSAHRWMNCNPSARLEQEFEDRETEAAAEGTAAHALCEHKLRRAMKMQSRKAWLTQHGMEIESLGKKEVATMLKDAPPDMREALILRQQLAKSSVKKYQAMQNCVCADGRAHGMFMFYGANRTGRFAGRLVQLQNLPQGVLAVRRLQRIDQIDQFICGEGSRTGSGDTSGSTIGAVQQTDGLAGAVTVDEGSFLGITDTSGKLSSDVGFHIEHAVLQQFLRHLDDGRNLVCAQRDLTEGVIALRNLTFFIDPAASGFHRAYTHLLMRGGIQPPETRSSAD